jgi:hypothetical protein
MSHKATLWVGQLDPALVGHSEFRILFHLADCHNVSAGCFPSQAYLIDRSGVSNGTLNDALKSLEAKGLIRRQRSYCHKTKRRRPTRYVLGFEMDEAPPLSPENGDRSGAPWEDCGTAPDGASQVSENNTKKSDQNGVSKLRRAGDGPISSFTPDLSPVLPRTYLRPTGEVTCKEPRNNLGAGAREVTPPRLTEPCSPALNARSDDAPDAALVFWAEKVRDGCGWVVNQITANRAREMLFHELVTVTELRAVGIPDPR